MRTILHATAGLLTAAALTIALQARAGGPHHAGCTGDCEPRCRATWREKRTSETVYEIRGEVACARDRDPWHAPSPKYRCHPPCGRLYVKKRLYKSEGEATLELVPRYAVELEPTAGCSCTACRSGEPPRWDPLGILSFLGLRGTP